MSAKQATKTAKTSTGSGEGRVPAQDNPETLEFYKKRLQEAGSNAQEVTKLVEGLRKIYEGTNAITTSLDTKNTFALMFEGSKWRKLRQKWKPLHQMIKSFLTASATEMGKNAKKVQLLIDIQVRPDGQLRLPISQSLLPSITTLGESIQKLKDNASNIAGKLKTLSKDLDDIKTRDKEWADTKKILRNVGLGVLAFVACCAGVAAVVFTFGAAVAPTITMGTFVLALTSHTVSCTAAAAVTATGAVAAGAGAGILAKNNKVAQSAIDAEHLRTCDKVNAGQVVLENLGNRMIDMTELAEDAQSLTDCCKAETDAGLLCDMLKQLRDCCATLTQVCRNTSSELKYGFIR